MSLYSKVTNALTDEGLRFVLETLAREFACNATVDEISESISDKTGMTVELDIDDFGVCLALLGELFVETPIERINLHDIDPTADGAELLGRRIYAALTRLNDQYIYDMSLAYEATDDYDDDYDDFDDLDNDGFFDY